jgi:hypothetical protein
MKKFENLGRCLSKAEQRNIMGGYLPDDEGGCSCAIAGPSTTGTCGVRKGGVTIIQNISQAEAIWIANHCTSTTTCNYYWCCASC